MKFSKKTLFLFFIFFTQNQSARATLLNDTATLETSNESYFGHLNVSLLAGTGGPFLITDSHYNNGNTFNFKTSVSYLLKNHFEIGSSIGMAGSSPTLGVDLTYYVSTQLFIGIDSTLKFSQSLYQYVGPKIGYDYHLNKRLTTGPELIYLVPVNSSTGIFEALISFKYFL